MMSDESNFRDPFVVISTHFCTYTAVYAHQYITITYYNINPNRKTPTSSWIRYNCLGISIEILCNNYYHYMVMHFLRVSCSGDVFEPLEFAQWRTSIWEETVTIRGYILFPPTSEKFSLPNTTFSHKFAHLMSYFNFIDQNIVPNKKYYRYVTNWRNTRLCTLEFRI